QITQQAMNHAIRSGIAITSGYAIRQCSRLLRNVKTNETERFEISSLQQRLESKIRIISPAIDMIELIAARGNTSLESAVTLTKALRWDIQSLGVRLAKAATDEELQRKGSSRAKSAAQNEQELKQIIADMRRLLERVEDAVPLISLAITTSGVNLSTALPSSVSPSRLLQASTFLTAGDTRYSMAPGQAVQVGPVFTLSLYMLFSGHAYRPQDEEGVRETTWKEVIHKARVKLLRIPLEKIDRLPASGEGTLEFSVHGLRSNAAENETEEIPSEGKAYEFGYQLLITEDLDDDRVHTFEDDQPQPGPFDDVALAGIREALPIHQISKIFYADTGKILNIGSEGETNNPILLLKRDINAIPPRRMMDREAEESQWLNDESDDDDDDEQPDVDAQIRRESSVAPEEETAGHASLASREWSLPPNLDPEWMAFEVYTEDPDSDEEDSLPTEEPSSTPPVPTRGNSLDPTVTAALSHLNLTSTTPPSSPRHHQSQLIPTQPLHSPAPNASYPTAPTTLPPLRTSLSLLELLIRLTALQQFQQCSHLAITDELLNFFLSEAGTTGAGGDAETRRRVRREARQRVGFDPYDESPVKRRGEEYLEHYGHDATTGGSEEGEGYGTPISDRRYSPALARGYGESFASGGTSDEPPLHFSARSGGASRNRPRVHMSPASSPGMSSPLLRKSMQVQMHPIPRPDALRREKSMPVGKSPLGRNERDSTLGTSPGSATLKDQGNTK
ncbi:Ran-binding-domain-containing protein, partial [Rhizodiscina lignyota]